MISYTITALQTVEPQTWSGVNSYEGGGTITEPSPDEFTGLTNGDTFAETAYSETQINGNVIISGSGVSSNSFTSAWAFTSQPENQSGETYSTRAAFSSIQTDGQVLTGENSANLVGTNTQTTRIVIRTTGHNVITQATQVRTTRTTTTTTQAWSTSQDGTNDPSIYSYTQATNIKTTGMTAGAKASTILLTDTEEETGYHDGQGNTAWPAYTTATVLILASNEVAWLATTKSEILTPIDSIAESHAGVVTVLPSFFTYSKHQEDIYNTSNNTGLGTIILAENSKTYKAQSSVSNQTIAVANTSIAKIPFQTIQALTQNVATSAATVTWEGTYKIGGSRRLGTSSGFNDIGLTSSITGNTTIEGPILIAQTIYYDTAPFTFVGTRSGIGGGSTADPSPDGDYYTTNSFENGTTIAYTGNNTQNLGFTSVATFQPQRLEQAFFNAAIAFGDTPALNFDLPIEIEGGFSIKKLSEVAAIPYPTSFTTSISGQPATVSIGDNITITRNNSTTSYDLEATGAAISTKNIKPAIGGGNSPDGHTLKVGPHVYEVHYATGGSATTSYSTQTILTFGAQDNDIVTAYRPVPMFLGIGENRYTVLTTATTATFFNN